MLIKRVVIQGFKTFAKRTEFVFDPGLTAIVGPNGSGKSNVVDAIRWCLGEQSFSLLRSKKTSDIIFSGSDQKARLGMAQVSLTLDNSSGELPIDFAELEITRRAYRDGDNEYLLNGQRVRLQDITDLLAQTGLGRRTYALIGQGLIDKVLSLAPEELRSLFEEAAGITGYQAKRATTLRRLEATEQNLTRVQDVIAELSPRLGYLRKQAERARERERIAADLRTLLRDWYGYHWHATLRRLHDQRAAAAALAQQVEAHRAALAGTNRQIERVRTQQAGLRGQLGELHRASSRLHRDAEQVGRELAVAQERLRQLQARQEEARRELAPLRLEQESATGRLAESERSLAAAQAAYRARQAQVDAVQRSVDQRQQERQQLQESQAAARRRLDELNSRRADAAGRLQQQRERQEALVLAREEQRRAHAASATEAERLIALLSGQETQGRDIDSQAQSARHTLAELEAQRSALQAQAEQTLQAQRRAERDLDRIQTRHDLLARLQQEGAGYANGVRAVLQAARQASSLTGVLGTVAGLLRVPAHLDKAIETALGGALQNVVTERWEHAQAAIEFLKRTGQGRATFLPLDRLVIAPALPAPRRPGILGNAAELVDYDPAITAAVGQLLDRVWIAQDLASARAALDTIRGGPRPTVVTLEGEIVRPGGAVTGGSDQERRDESLLARARELRELPGQLRRAQTAVQEQAAAAGRLAAEVEATLQHMAPVQAQLTGLARQERELRGLLEQTRRGLDRARQSERWQAERLAATEQELAAVTRTCAELEEQLQRLDGDRAAAETEHRAATDAVESAGEGDLLRDLADLRASAAEAHGTWQSRQAVLDAQQQSLQTVLEQIAAKERQIARLAAEEGTLAGRIADLAGQEAALSQAIAAQQAQIDPVETQLAALEGEQAALEAHERGQQETLRKDEAVSNAAVLQHQRSEDELRRLRHDIEQDLGLVLLETGEELAYQPPLPWDAVVEQLQPHSELPEGLENDVRDLRARLGRVSNVNPDAPREYAEAAGRHDYLLSQSADLTAAVADLRKVLRELDTVMEAELQRTFAAVADQFVYYFQLLFNGGSAKLVLATPEDIANSGIEIIARPPGKRPQSLALLSGGERTLTACALIFAILRVSPTPFCVLDEVDAALDEANVDRFRQTLGELSRETQFIVITHNRRTLEGTNAIYGVTMSTDGASRVISLRLEGERIARRPDDPQPSGDSTDQDMAALEELVKL